MLSVWIINLGWSPHWSSQAAEACPCWVSLSHEVSGSRCVPWAPVPGLAPLGAAHVVWNDCSSCWIGVFCFLILTPVLSLGRGSVPPLGSQQYHGKAQLVFFIGQVRLLIFWDVCSLWGVGKHFGFCSSRSLLWLSGHRPTKGMSLLSIPGVRISATFRELGGKRPEVGVCLTGSDNSSCLPGDDYQLVNLPSSNCSSHLFLGERESARSRGNVIIWEAGILSFGSFTLKDGKANPRLHGSMSSVQPIETRLHVFIYPQENLLIQHQ